MSDDALKSKITANMTILDIVANYPSTETVFHCYDEVADECLFCNHLFDTVKAVAQNYNLDIKAFMQKIINAALDKE